MCKYIRFIFSPSSASSSSSRQLYDSYQFVPCHLYFSTGIKCPKSIVSPFHPPIAPDSPSASGTSLASTSYTHRRSSTLAVASASPRNIAYQALPNQTFAPVKSPSRSPVSDNSGRHDRSHHYHHYQSTSSKSNSAPPHRSRDHKEASSDSHSQSKSHLHSQPYTSTGHRRLSTTAHIPRTIPENPSSYILPNMSSKSSAQQHQSQQTSPSLSESRMRQSHQSGVNDKDSQHKKKRATSRTRARRQSVSPYSSLSEASDDEDEDEDDRHKQSIRHKLRREIARERERMQMKKAAASGSGSSGRSSSKVRHHEDASAEADETERRAHRHSKQTRFYEAPLIFSDSDDEDTRQLRINARIAAHNREISRRPSHDSASSTPSTTHTTTIVSSSRAQSPKSSTSSTKTSKFKSTSKATANSYVRPNVEMTVNELVASDAMEYGSGAPGRASNLVDARRPRSTRQSGYDGMASWQQIQKKLEEEAMRERLKERLVPRYNQPQAW